MITTAMTIAACANLMTSDPQEDTIWAREFERVEFVGNSWTAYRMHMPDDPIPVSREIGEMLMYDRALGIPDRWGDYEYAFILWTNLGEVILSRPDPYADIRPGGGIDEMDDFDD